jgi:(2R)-sulfolactate sulfo-lyase subunit alpha
MAEAAMPTRHDSVLKADAASEARRTMIHFLVHDTVDNVGVAVVDIPPGTDCTGRDLSTNKPLQAKSLEAIPLGHKIALKDFKVGEDVTKYACVIGRITRDVAAGHHVHTQNLKTKRWA